MTTESDMVNLEDIVRSWGKEQAKAHKIPKVLLSDILPSDISWKHVRFHHQETVYSKLMKEPTTGMKVLFSSHFRNETSQAQVFTLKTERGTRATCNITMDRSYMTGDDVNLQIGLPSDIIKANAGFKTEMTVTRKVNETYGEELAWSVDNKISVPRNCCTDVELVFKEEGYNGTFEVETKIVGEIHVVIRTKANEETRLECKQWPFTGNVKTIFADKDIFNVRADGVYFKSSGRCTFRYGIEQRSKVSESALQCECAARGGVGEGDTGET